MGLKNKPADYGHHPDGISPEAINEAATTGRRKTARTYRTTQRWKLQEAIQTRTFWFIMVMYTMIGAPLYLITTHGVLHMTDGNVFTRMQAAYILSLVVLSGGIARFPVGWLADYIEPRWLAVIMLTGMLLSIVVFWQLPGLTALIIAACVFGFCYGAGLVLMPTIIANYYSPPPFAGINGFIWPFTTAFSSMVPIMAGYLHDTTKSYDTAFMVIGGLLVMVVACAILATAPLKRMLVEAESQ